MFFSGEGFFFFFFSSLLLFPTDEQAICVDFLIGSGVSSPPPLPSLVPVCQTMYFLAAEMKKPLGLTLGGLSQCLEVCAQGRLCFLLMGGEAASMCWGK